MRSKRESILETAEHDFLEKGYAGTSIDSIVREVGGSKSTVYSHFRDKKVLFAAALADVQSEFDFRLPRSIKLDAADICERLSFMGAELLTLVFSERAIHLLRTLVAESKQFPDVARQFFDEGLEVAIEVIANVLEQASGAGEITDTLECGPAARDFVSLLTGDLYLKLLLGLCDPPAAPEIARRASRAARLFTQSIKN